MIVLRRRVGPFLLPVVLLGLSASLPPVEAFSMRSAPQAKLLGNDPYSSQSTSACAGCQEGLSRARFLNQLVTTAAGLVLAASGAVLPANAMTVALPSPGEIERDSIPSDWEDIENPFSDDDAKTQFARLDSSEDSVFYTEPRFVEHIDEQAVRLLTDYVSREAIVNGRDDTVLDLCSSWTSHISSDVASRLSRVAGIGMNAKELSSNTVLTEWVVQDLNKKPQLPYKDQTFSVVLCQLSIDYLTRPLEVMEEVYRVLKPGGTVHVLFSNRLFLSKAVAIWTGADDIDHAFTVGSYLHFCNAGFRNIEAKDLSFRQGKDRRIVGDPLYVVRATRPAG